MPICVPTASLSPKVSRRLALGSGESGRGMIRAVAWLAALAAFGYVCSLLIPALVDNYQLQDAMKNEARFALVEHKDQEQIREDIYRTARDLGIPARLNGIDVEPIAGGYRITVNYTIPFRIFHHRFDWRFHTTADSSSI